MTKPTWKYTNPAELVHSRIYTEKELDQTRERIIFPVERPDVLNDLTREMRGHPLGNSEGSLLKLLNQNAMERIIDNTWTRIWTKFLTFGTISAGINSYINEHPYHQNYSRHYITMVCHSFSLRMVSTSTGSPMDFGNAFPNIRS